MVSQVYYEEGARLSYDKLDLYKHNKQYRPRDRFWPWTARMALGIL